MLPEFQTVEDWAGVSVDLRDLGARRPGGLAKDLLPAFIGVGEAERNLNRLEDPDVRCVTTGQQPGLFTGPLYTISKALTAVALAERLEESTGAPVVPVFWVAGDDHDFAEANHLHTLDLDNELQKIVIRERDPSAPLTPLYREKLGTDVDEALDSVSTYAPETEFKADVLEWLAEAYGEDDTFAGAFAKALANLLGDYGLLVFDPTHETSKRQSVPYIEQALREAAELNDELTRRAKELESDGHDVPVQVGDGASLVMFEAEQGRDRLMISDGRFQTRRSGQSWTVSELADLLREQPGGFSPNVLLRPAVEAGLLPTLAYCAGPGELKYLPQVEPVYRRLEITPPAHIPRWSVRVIEKKIGKVLEKYQLSPGDLDCPPGQVEGRIVRSSIPPEAQESLNSLRRTISEEYENLKKAAGSLDPTLKRSVDSSRNNSLAAAAELEKKLVSHLKQRNEVVNQQIAKARNSLFPGGKPQERVINLTYFLVRYGRDFLKGALDECRSWAAELEL